MFARETFATSGMVVIGVMDLATIGSMEEEELRTEVREVAESLCRQRADLLSLAERERPARRNVDMRSTRWIFFFSFKSELR